MTTKSKLKVYLLADNCSGKQCGAEWGLSLYIEATSNILFDFGASNLFLRNAQKMGLDVHKADYYVLSHGHWDHGTGLEYLNIPNKELICHPEAFIKRYRDEQYIGLPFSIEEAQAKFKLNLTKEPFEIDKHTIFLGEVPRKNDFESKNTIFYKENGLDKDFVRDDSALVFKTEQGLIIISGCAHAGICNTVDYAMKVTGIDQVHTVMGGFHLKTNDSVTQKTIEYLKNLEFKKVIPTHCTEFPAMVEFNKHFASQQLHVGQILEL